MQPEKAKDLLAGADRARSLARTWRRGAWFALGVFGILVLGASPLYRMTDKVTYPGGISMVTYGGWWTSLYWLIAVPLGYAACVYYYRRHALRTGVAGALWPYVATGLGLFALMFLVPPGVLMEKVPSFSWGWDALPLITLGAGFLVLSRLERSWPLAVFSLGLLFLPMLTGRIYDTFLGWQEFSSTGFSMMVAGVALLLAGAISWMARERSLESR